MNRRNLALLAQVKTLTIYHLLTFRRWWHALHADVMSYRPTVLLSMVYLLFVILLGPQCKN